MGSVHYGSAAATASVCRAIQNSQESLRRLAKRCGITLKTAAKWKKRTSTVDRPIGPKEPRSTAPSLEEALAAAFRRSTALSLDDCLHALQPTLLHLTRSSLHRGLQRHGISRLPAVKGGKPEKKTFKSTPARALRQEHSGKSTPARAPRSAVFTSTWPRRQQPRASFISLPPLTGHPNSPSFKRQKRQLAEKAARTTASVFLAALIKAVPCKIHTVLADDGIAFRRAAPTERLPGP